MQFLTKRMYFFNSFDCPFWKSLCIIELVSFAIDIAAEMEKYNA